jgi:hypothetical protein
MKYLMILLMLVAGCGAYDDGSDELGSNESALIAKKDNTYGLWTLGWRADTWNPERCTKNSGYYCLVPKTNEVCVNVVAGLRTTLGAAILSKLEDFHDLTGYAYAYLGGGCSGMDRVDVTAGAFQGYDWTSNSYPDMEYVVRIGCGDYSTVLSEPFASDYQQCHFYGAQVDIGRLNTWFSNFNMDQAAKDRTYAHIGGYIVAISRGVGNNTSEHNVTYSGMDPEGYEVDEFAGEEITLISGYDVNQNTGQFIVY